MDVRMLGRSFNYVVSPEIYYTQVLVWIFNVTFCISTSPLCFRTGTELQFVLDAFNTFGVLVPARDIVYTNISHNVIPLSLCKYTLFSQKWRLFIFATRGPSFDKNNRRTTHRKMNVIPKVLAIYTFPDDGVNTLIALLNIKVFPALLTVVDNRILR